MMKYTIAFKPDAQVLELGGGDNPLTDQNGNQFTFNMDIRKGPKINLVHNLRKIPWPLDDSSFDGVFARYLLEHLPYRELPGIIREAYRILKPGGKIIVFVPNIIEQCKLALKWGAGDRTNEMLYGSQEFEGDLGCHKSCFDEKHARELFKDFRYIKTLPHPKAPSDLIIEAYKLGEDVFERAYFDEDGTYGYQGYRDFATHHSTARILMENHPESLLDVGGARGYVVRILKNQGVRAVCMDISKNAWHNRATDSFVLHDARKIPWPFKDKEFDICFSINFLEHIEEKYLDDVIKEMARVSKRGVHGIHFNKSPFKEENEDLDITHVSMFDEPVWRGKFEKIVPNFPVRIGHPRLLEFEEPEKNPPVSHMSPPPDDKIKLNLGSFADMFYHWINIDIINLSEFAQSQKYIFKQHDLTKGIPYKDEEVDLIVSNHLLEHFSRDEGKKLLNECYRVLKPGGICRINVPDAKFLTEEYLNGNIMKYRVINTGVEKAKDDAEAFHEILMAGHKTLFDEPSLKRMMEKAGFKNVQKTDPFHSCSETIQKETLSTHPSISVICEGIR